MTSQSERSIRARIASHESWARTPDRVARTAPARAAMQDKFEREVDPDGELAPAERAKRAENARQAYFQRLALKSVASRRKAADARKAAEQYDRDAAEADDGLDGEA